MGLRPGFAPAAEEDGITMDNPTNVAYGVRRGFLPNCRVAVSLLFLMNAPGNRHTLAVRFLALWLESRGMNTRIVDEHADLDALMHDVADARSGFLLISMALPEQRDHVAEVAAHIQALPAPLRPRLLVGGYPVKVGLIQSIPGADLVTDISALSFA